MGALIALVTGVWLLTQATAGRLPARVLSYREGFAGDPLASSTTYAPGMLTGAAAGITRGVPDTGTLTIDQVAAVALNAGLTREAAATATAIAMRESSGQTGAHNPVYPDDSYGLWQINRLAHPQYSPAQLRTASGNAAAMVALSQNGTNWQPWQIGGNPLARTNITAARAAVARIV